MNKILNGLELAQQLNDDLAKKISSLQSKPHLVILNSNFDPSSKIYVAKKLEAAKKIGIKASEVDISNFTLAQLTSKVYDLNNDNSVHGIILQMPLNKQLSNFDFNSLINVNKDVDGFSNVTVAKISCNEKVALLPCTPQAIFTLLKHSKISLASKNCLVIGRSKIVGRPLAQMLINADATVTVAHSKTKDLHAMLSNYDIVFCAIGKPGFIKASQLKPKSTFIDVGISRLDSGKVVGDLEVDCETNEITYSPVPGGVGPLTVSMIMQNLFVSYNLVNESSKK